MSLDTLYLQAQSCQSLCLLLKHWLLMIGFAFTEGKGVLGTKGNTAKQSSPCVWKTPEKS